MNANIIAQVHDSNSVKNRFSKTLKNGSSVLVRVISAKGNGKYEGSVAGIRTLFSAKNALTPGTVFSATVSLNNGKIFITPKDKTNQIFQNKIDVISFYDESYDSENVFESVENQNVANFLSQLSLPSDKLSLHLILQFKQMDMKFDSGLLNKIRSVAIKYPGKEKKVSELVSLMIKKGILISEDEIDELLNELEFSLDETDVFEEYSEEKPLLMFERLVSDYFNQLFKGVNQDKVGLLTVLNQCYQKNDLSQNKNWIFLPFEIVQKVGDEKRIEGKGNFNLFFHNQNELRIMNINCSFKNKEFLFRLKFDKKKLCELKFNVSSESENAINESEIQKLITKLQNDFADQKVNVEWINKSLLEGTGCENEKLFLFSGEI